MGLQNSKETRSNTSAKRSMSPKTNRAIEWQERAAREEAARVRAEKEKKTKTTTTTNVTAESSTTATKGGETTTTNTFTFSYTRETRK